VREMEPRDHDRATTRGSGGTAFQPGIVRVGRCVGETGVGRPSSRAGSVSALVRIDSEDDHAVIFDPIARGRAEGAPGGEHQGHRLTRRPGPLPRMPGSPGSGQMLRVPVALRRGSRRSPVRYPWPDEVLTSAPRRLPPRGQRTAAHTGRAADRHVTWCACRSLAAQGDLARLRDVAGPGGSQSLAETLASLPQEPERAGEGARRGGALRISPGLFDEVCLKGRSDLAGRFERWIDGPFPRGAGHHVREYPARPARPPGESGTGRSRRHCAHMP
jgi:hypothetical protein